MGLKAYLLSRKTYDLGPDRLYLGFGTSFTRCRCRDAMLQTVVGMRGDETLAVVNVAAVVLGSLVVEVGG